MGDKIADLASAIDGLDSSRAIDVEIGLNRLFPERIEIFRDFSVKEGDDEPEVHVRIAFDYKVGVEGRYVVLKPLLVDASGNRYPPDPKAMSSGVLDTWEQLANLVTAPFAVARFEHLLFEGRRGNGQSRAVAAAVAYMRAAGCWSSPADSLDDFDFAAGLSRAVGARDLNSDALDQIIRIVEAALIESGPPFGIVVRGLRALVRNGASPSAVSDLLDAAFNACTDIFQQDQILEMQISKANKELRLTLHEKRVNAWLDAAGAAEGLLRASHLKTALERAESSGDSALVKKATVALQALRLENLGMVAFESHSNLTRASVEEIIRPITDASSILEALVVFANFGPVTGSFEDTKVRIAEQAKMFPFLHLLPTEMYGHHNLPRFAANDDELKLEMVLARQELMAIEGWSPFIAMALSEVAQKHGIPGENELAAIFGDLPSLDDAAARAVARAFIRFWCSDYLAAAFIAAAQIENVARNLLVALDAGVYRLQRDEKPGQYPGLGFMLQALKENGLDESWQRFILTLTANPAGGWNLRNGLMHGSIVDVGPAPAAYLLQALLYLATRVPSPQNDVTDN